VAAGLIEEAEERPDPELDDERRRYYRITRLGARVLRAETDRVAVLLDSARAKKVRACRGPLPSSRGRAFNWETR
jgi:DNA-binding PadR family transcriptional regulator